MAQHANGSIKEGPQPGVYYIDGATWAVGARYQLLKQLGEGSFSQVCLAVDRDTGEKVALKRIPDVLNSLENAKRVLREVCILRRMDHPGIIALKDVFLRPASSGRFVYRKGALVPTSLDLYLALEFCDQGDLFHLRGQISESDVKSIMFQLLQALQYLHENGVWHRDVKTANILVTYDGVRLAKIADLGSARSATARNAAASAASPPASLRAGRRGAAAAGGGPAAAAAAAAGLGFGGGGGGDAMRHSDSFMADGAQPSCSELFARPAAGGGAGFKCPLTRLVCTPCYRAPEVVMSRGVYTEAIDVWSAGCVFGELLQRVPWLGKASTPHLQVAPVFAMQGAPQTPAEGQRFETRSGKAGNTTTRLELKALFQVIGTPSWKCIEDVPSEAWRNYLRKIPGRAPSLYRRFGVAGEVAVDLLHRLLTFDPSRRARLRASCAEAMGHEYFVDVRAAAALDCGADCRADPDCRTAPGGGAEETETASEEEGGGAAMFVDAPDIRGGVALHGRALAAAGADAEGGAPGGGGAAPGGAPRSAEQEEATRGMRMLSMDVDESEGGDLDGSEAPEGAKRPPRREGGDDGSGGGGSFAAARGPKRARQHSGGGAGGGGLLLGPQNSFFEGETGEHYYNIDDPAVALAKLEEEMGAILDMLEEEMGAVLDMAEGGNPGPPSGSGGAPGEAAAAAATDAFRELLQREVSEHIQHLEARRARGPSRGGAAGGGAAPAAAPRLDGGGGGAPKPASPAQPRRPGGSSGPNGGPAGASSPYFNAGSANARRAAAASSAGGGGAGMIGREEGWEHARHDPGGAVDPSLLAQRRLPYHADSEQASLEAEKHLKAGRHGEWAADALQAGPKKTSWGVTLVPPGYDEAEHPLIAEKTSWGVTLVPPGYDEAEHPLIAVVIRRQNKI
ncbi:MAG: kinase-like domain-containing protein [Monoraphidium minutum]|nr:MAG: kinase-like domain-containing protein [Monoraphidium minutum]